MQFGVGVIGATGYIGVPYREEIRQSQQATIVALCARRRDLLEQAGAADNATMLTDDWREVVEHPQVDVVLVATPDALHHQQVLACAAAGRHVVCEKPLGMNAHQAREMWLAYRDLPQAHFVPFWTRYVPLFARAKALYQQGLLGEIRAVVYRWHNPRPPDMPFTWRDDAELSSAGSIADVGSHAYDCMRWILQQDATRVLAMADVLTAEKPDLGAINLEEALQAGSHDEPTQATRRTPTAVDFADIAFRWQNGAVGSLLLSHATFLRTGLAPELELHGQEASLSVDRVSGRLTLVRRNRDPEILEPVADAGSVNRFAQFVFPALRSQIESGSRDHPTLEDGYRVQLFTDAASRSATDGGWVEIEDHRVS